MMRSFLSFVEHPLVHLSVAMILIITSLIEGWDSFWGDMATLDVGAHHGVLVLGLVNLLRSLAEVMETTAHLQKSG